MIREAVSQDLSGILTIYNDAILHTTAVYFYEPQTLEERLQWFEQKKNEEYPVLVSEIDHQIAGFATFGPFRPRPAYQYSIEHSVYVDPAFRNRGVATDLLTELIAIAYKRKYKTLIAGIDAANEPSIALHQKLGFVHSGTLQKVGFKFNNWLDLAFYQLQLDGPDHSTEPSQVRRSTAAFDKE